MAQFLAAQPSLDAALEKLALAKLAAAPVITPKEALLGPLARERALLTQVDDIGVVINHSIAEGQLHGGIVQGAGQVFGEQVIYDPETGQSLTASFMDYYMPRAGLIPEVRGDEHPTPSKVSPLGVKGVGESGCTASIPALASTSWCPP